MKCKKCGYEISENDRFCENCGAQIIKEELNQKTEEPMSKQNTKEVNVGKKKKSIMKKVFAAVAVVTVILIMSVIYVVYPNDIKMEAEELAALLNNEDTEDTAQYYFDNLYIHGYIVRRQNSSDEEGYYALTSDINNLDNMDAVIIFSYDKEIDSDLGTGSEVTIQGRLVDEGDEDIPLEILHVENIEVHNKVEPVHIFTSTTDLIEESVEYLNKKVQVLGKLVITNMSGAYITNERLVDSIWLYGISSSELFDAYQRGDWCNIKGKLILDNGTLALEVESIEQNEYTDELSINYDDISVDYLLQHAEQLAGAYVTVIGNLGMDYTEVAPGVFEPVLYNDDISDYVQLSGKTSTVGGCTALVSGKVEIVNGTTRLMAESYEPLD